MSDKQTIYDLVKDLNYISGDIPVDIIKLANIFRFDVMKLNESNDRTYKSNLSLNKDFNKSKNEKRGTIYLDTSDIFNQRVAIAYHLSNVMLFSYGIIDITEFKKRLRVEKSIPENNGYYMALSLLCPDDEFKSMLKGDNFSEVDNETQYLTSYSIKYRIGIADIINYIRFISWDGGFENE